MALWLGAAAGSLMAAAAGWVMGRVLARRRASGRCPSTGVTFDCPPLGSAFDRALLPGVFDADPMFDRR